MIVFGVCALGVGALYLVPGVARSPEQIRHTAAREEATNSAGGVGPASPEESASASGNRDSAAGGRDEAARTALGAQPTQPSATRARGRSSGDDDRSADNGTGDDRKGSKDSEPPQPVADIEPAKVTSKRLTIDWPAARDNVGVIGYRIWLNGFEVATTAETKAELRWFNEDSGQHVVQIRAVDAAGNQSQSSPTLMVTRPSPEPTGTPTPDPSGSGTPGDQSSGPSHPAAESAESASGTPKGQSPTPKDEHR
jgi:hypothetical protein